MYRKLSVHKAENESGMRTCEYSEKYQLITGEPPIQYKSQLIEN